MAQPLQRLPQVPLGSQGLMVSAQGLGCMGMSAFYLTPEQAAANEDESLRVFDRALELGLNFLDTSDMYGPYTNEKLIAKALKGRRKEFVVATKFGIVFENGKRGLDSSRKHVREACEGSLQRLETDYIDLYYQHRVDPNTPIEETMAELKLLHEEGKIKYIGLSEAPADIIRRAHAIHPITCIQQEWSLWARDLEDELVGVCRELGIGIVPYSPLGRGFLTAALTKDDLHDNDFRKVAYPRISDEHFQSNMKVVEKLKAIAEAKHVKPGQVALAWVHRKGKDVVPIPGTKRVKYLEENVAAYFLTLTPEEIRDLDELSSSLSGDRYAPESMGSTFRNVRN